MSTEPLPLEHPDSSPSEPTAPEPTAPRRAHPRLLVGFALVAVTVYVADQLTKVWAVQHLLPGEPRAFIGTVIQLNLIYNPGAALSFGTGMTWLLTLLALGVTAVVIRAARRIGSTAWALTLGLLLGGAVGNLYDRLFREPGVARGHVVDFIDYHGLFIGNVADIAIVSAAGLVMILTIRGIRLDGTRESAVQRPGDEVAQP